MPKLIVFNHVSLDGYFTDTNGDMSWAHADDPEWNAFVAENAGGGGHLVLGRVTYEMMASFWPTPAAMETMPDVANPINEMPKSVFSRTLDEATWQNTTLLKGDAATEMRRLKAEPGPGMVILGSGTIVAQLAQEGLIDEFQIVVNPVVVGNGRTLFEGVAGRPALNLIESRAFANGKVLLRYEPARS